MTEEEAQGSALASACPQGYRLSHTHVHIHQMHTHTHTDTKITNIDPERIGPQEVAKMVVPLPHCPW